MAHPRALILVGGYGTRLRPFTWTVPKPLIPFINKPIVQHQIEALVAVGVKEIILAVNYQPKQMLDFLKVCEDKYGVKIICSQEDVPLGTAGPLALAKKLLQTADGAPFFMFNSDVICEYPLDAMLAQHKSTGAEGTILVTQVTDPSKYGVVISKPNNQVERFVEKPQVFVSDKINAGIYLLSPSVCNRVELRPTSIEREIFPAMADESKLYSMVLPGYWMDIGQPHDFLTGQVLHLESMTRKRKAETMSSPGKVAGGLGQKRKRSGSMADEIELETKAEDYTIIGNIVVDPKATIGAGAVIGPDVVVAEGVTIGAGARVKRTCLFAGATVGDHAYINSSIIGWQATVGKWARVETSYVGEDVTIKDEISLFDSKVCPHKGVKENTSSKIII